MFSQLDIPNICEIWIGVFLQVWIVEQLISSISEGGDFFGRQYVWNVHITITEELLSNLRGLFYAEGFASRNWTTGHGNSPFYIS